MTETSERTPMDWEQRFRDEETPWERGALHPAVQHWHDLGLPATRNRMIIPGCGRAPELLYFAEAGYDVTAADLSQTAIDWQAENLRHHGVEATLVSGDVFEHEPSSPYDCVWEQTFLCAIPPRLRETYERSVHDWLKPGGILLALFMQKDERGGPPYGCSLEAMRELFPADRWAWPEDASFVAFPHPRLNGKPELGGVLTRL